MIQEQFESIREIEKRFGSRISTLFVSSAGNLVMELVDGRRLSVEADMNPRYEALNRYRVDGVYNAEGYRQDVEDLPDYDKEFWASYKAGHIWKHKELGQR